MPKKILAISNYRVSSDEQLLNNSLARQEKSVLQAADEHGAEIIKSWSGSVSSKKGSNVDRKDLDEMLLECKRNPKIELAIFDELDRFMRAMLEIGYFIVQFKKVGVRVIFASQPNLNTDTATDTLLLMLEAFKAEGSNEERQRKSIAGQTAALKEGRYPFSPKPGYKRGYERAVQEPHPIHGPILKATLLDIFMRRVTPTLALINFNKSDFTLGHSPYKMDKFRVIVTDPFYAGIVEIDKQVKVRNENGLHEALISKEQHLELLRIMNDKKKTQSGPRKNGNPKYPLSNFVSCDLCKDKSNGRYVGYDHGNGKNPALVYEKYRCRACRRYLMRQELHPKIEKQFKDNPITPDGKKDLIEALNIVWKQSEGQAEQEALRVRHQIKALGEAIVEQVEAATDPGNSSIKQEILDSIAKKKDQILDLEDQLAKLSTEADSDKEQFLKFAFNFIENMGSNFLDTDIVSQENRLRCKQIVFPAGFYLDEKNRVYTPEVSELYRLATKKKSTEVLDNSRMVRVQGLKPWTSSLARKRSID
jgi:DNA invertase Pin-like site-specific DNA recombinase